MKIYEYDIIIIGAGIAGLWLGNRLKRDGYNVVLIEKGNVGGVQTLASQGMIHGGQKYSLTGKASHTSANIAAMPKRWEACFAGQGDIDLSCVKFISNDQVMWSAGSAITSLAVLAAAKSVNAKTTKLKPKDYPAPLAEMDAKNKLSGAVYHMPERVLEVKSLVESLASELQGRIFKGSPSGLTPEGHIAVADIQMRAQTIIFTAGSGNEQAFEMLGIEARHTQRRPLRQVMVKPLPFALNGHGVVASHKPRATITSHPLGDGSYVWYLGGNIAEQGAHMEEAKLLAFARSELTEMFPLIDWSAKEWASWAGDRAEPFNEKGHLPPGPHIYQSGRCLIAWPTKLTFAPSLADHILDLLHKGGIAPRAQSAPPPLPEAYIGTLPWENAVWTKIAEKA